MKRGKGKQIRINGEGQDVLLNHYPLYEDDGQTRLSVTRYDIFTPGHKVRRMRAIHKKLNVREGGWKLVGFMVSSPYQGSILTLTEVQDAIRVALDETDSLWRERVAIG